MNFEHSEINEPLKLLLHPSYKIGMKGYINLAVFGLYKLSRFLVLVLVLKIFKKRIHKKKKTDLIFQHQGRKKILNFQIVHT